MKMKRNTLQYRFHLFISHRYTFENGIYVAYELTNGIYKKKEKKEKKNTRDKTKKDKQGSEKRTTEAYLSGISENAGTQVNWRSVFTGVPWLLRSTCRNKNEKRERRALSPPYTCLAYTYEHLATFTREYRPRNPTTKERCIPLGGRRGGNRLKYVVFTSVLMYRVRVNHARWKFIASYSSS